MAKVASAAAAMLDALLVGDPELREWSNVAAEVMRLCVRHDPGRAAWTDRGFSDDDETAEDILYGATGEFLSLLDDVRDGDAIIAGVRRLTGIRAHVLGVLDGADELTACLRLFGLAQAIDQGIISRTVMRRPISGRVQLRTGDLIVVPTPVRGERHGWITDASRLESRLFSRTQRLRLLPESNFQVTVDHHAWDVLDQLVLDSAGERREMHGAVAQPNPDVESFDIKFSLDGQGFGSGRPLSEVEAAVSASVAAGASGKLRGKFTNLGPLDAHGVQGRARQIVGEAVAAGANVVVLPEYALADTGEFEVELGSLPLKVPTLVTAGVRREPNGGTGSVSACHAWLCLPPDDLEGEPRVLGFDLGSKALPAEYTLRVGSTPATKVVLKEGLRGGDLVVLRSPHSAIAGWICRDATDDSLTGTLIELSPTLLLVPAMSAKTGLIEALMWRVVSLCQTVAIVGNGPPSWGSERASNISGRAEAIFARPAAVGGVISAPSATAPAPPDGQLGFWRYRFWADVEPTWVPHAP